MKLPDLLFRSSFQRDPRRGQALDSLLTIHHEKEIEPIKGGCQGPLLSNTYNRSVSNTLCQHVLAAIYHSQCCSKVMA